MVISKTPFRVSLAGGGSDFAEYYTHGAGHVVAFAINHYMYVTVNRRFDRQIRVSYTRTEIVDSVSHLKHDLIREALKMTGIVSGVEVTTIADLPAGIGLGSSSALTVGVLHALYALKGEWHEPEDLARRACRIEIDILGRPIGKQDQYMAAYGGMQDVRFNPDGSVRVEPIICTAGARRRLSKRLVLCFTGQQRRAATILRPVRANLNRGSGRADVTRLVEIAGRVRGCLTGGNIDHVGALLDQSWTFKKRMAARVSNDRLDRLYARARRAGADGGKVVGAGGGGCLLLFVRPAALPEVRGTMRRAGLTEIPFEPEPEGSRIIHYST